MLDLVQRRHRDLKQTRRRTQDHAGQEQCRLAARSRQCAGRTGDRAGAACTRDGSSSRHAHQPVARQSRSAAGSIPALHAGQGRARPGPAQSRSTTVRAPMDGIATQVDQIQLGRFVDRRHADVHASSTPRSPGSMPTRRNRISPMSRSARSVDPRRRRLSQSRLQGHRRFAEPGTGAQFAILPPQNATGNFVKVVQRVPVRIYFDSHDKYVQQAEGRHERLHHHRHRHRRSLGAPARLRRRPRRTRTSRP